MPMVCKPSQLRQLGGELVDEDVGWFHRYVGFAATKHALTEALLEAAPESDVLLLCRTALMTAGTALIERAQETGVVRRTRRSPTSEAWSAGSRSCRRAIGSRPSGCCRS